MTLSPTVPKRPGYGDVFSVFAIILCAAIAAQAYAGYRKFAELRSDGVITEGYWADRYTDPRDGELYVVYYFWAGYEIYNSSQRAPEGISYTRGDAVPIVYSPDNPNLSRIAGTEAIQYSDILILIIGDVLLIFSLQYLFAYYTRRSAWLLWVVAFVRRIVTGQQPYRPQLSEEDIQRQTAERAKRKRRLRRNIKWGIIVGVSVLAGVLMIVLIDYVQDARLRAKYESRAEKIEEDAIVQEFDGVAMVLVPAGCFDMGTDGAGGRQCFDEPFWIDQYEVTNAQYGSTGCKTYAFQPAQPRNCISWMDARDFCESREARLPTEAEWEYAARGPSNLVYTWGNDFLGDNTVYLDNSGGQTAAVGSRSNGVSWAGAYDLSGNVWEWTSTLYRDYPYTTTDGRELGTSDNNQRVLRGGSFDNSEDFLRTTVRYSASPGYLDVLRGFRCVRPHSNP